MEGGRSLPFQARGYPHVTLGLCILITVCERAGELARTTDVPNVAAAPRSAIHRAVRSQLMTRLVRRCLSLTVAAVQVWLGCAWCIHRGGLDLFKGL